MNNFKSYLGLALAGALVFAVGCQPEPNRNDRRFGRNAFGSPNQTPKYASTQTTAVINPQGDGKMTEAAALLAAPALNSNPEWSLGTVSAQNGVRMWAEVDGKSGSIESSRSRIHIEVTDSRMGQADGMGGTLGKFTLHIGYDQVGYRGAEGGLSGGAVAIRFDQDGYGSVLVVGTVTGNTFSGELSFVNTYTDNQQRSLGNFSMQACAFFVCQ